MNEPTSYGLEPPSGGAGTGVPRQHSESAGQGAQGDPAAPTVPQGAAGSAGSRLLGGRYRLTGKLGYGGMGTVWRARDERVDREVAVKEPRVPEDLPDRERSAAYQRMRREARAAARIDHPAVVTVHDVVIEDEQPWLVMELVRGESLAEVLESGTLGVRDAARIALSVLGALSAAHDAGVLHRDVKPGNVLLGAHDRVVLTDFGIAQVEGEQGLTETGAFVGSPEYIAPERALGQRPGAASDLWSLGVLLYVAVEGVSPFRRSNTAATVQAVLTATPQQPARMGERLGGLVMRLLAKEPGTRPDAAEIRRELTAIADPPPPAVPQLPPTRVDVSQGAVAGRLLPSSRRGRLLVGGGALAAVLALLLVVVLNPFGGGLPDDWELHSEEALGVEWAIPEGYRKIEPPSDGEGAAWRQYVSPDLIYRITLWHYNPEERDALTVAGEVRNGHAQDSDTYAAVESRFYQREFRGMDAAEVSLETLRWDAATTVEEAEEANQRRFGLMLYAADPEHDQLWSIQVSMPVGPGPARAHGEEIYETLLAHTSLEAQEQAEPPADEAG